MPAGKAAAGPVVTPALHQAAQIAGYAGKNAEALRPDQPGRIIGWEAVGLFGPWPGHMQKAVQQTTQRSGGKSTHGSYEDMLRLFAAMEAVPWQYRQEMGQWMLTRLKRADETVQTWWAIGRIAARH